MASIGVFAPARSRASSSPALTFEWAISTSLVFTARAAGTALCRDRPNNGAGTIAFDGEEYHFPIASPPHANHGRTSAPPDGLLWGEPETPAQPTPEAHEFFQEVERMFYGLDRLAQVAQEIRDLRAYVKSLRDAQ